MSARPDGRATQRPRSSVLSVLLVGAGLLIGAVVLALLDSLLDLEVTAVLLPGLAVGAAVGLVPDRSALLRLVGFGGGVVVALVGYLVRAAVLPDTSTGQLGAVVLTLLLCTALAVSTLGRLPLWSTLLGAGAFAAVYERTFAAAPPEVLSSSANVGSALALTAALGFAVVAVLGPPTPQAPAHDAVPASADDVPSPTAARGHHTMESSR